MKEEILLEKIWQLYPLQSKYSTQVQLSYFFFILMNKRYLLA